MAWIIAGIDGTGSRTWLPVRHGSAVQRLIHLVDAQGGEARYFHGPDSVLLGLDSSAILAEVVDFLQRAYRQALALRDALQTNAPPRIALLGHSRGGLVAILAAARAPVCVDFLGLLDAVDRNPFLGAETIRNVRFTAHARRHPTIGSRPSYGATGLSSDGAYEQHFFHTSHGGIGGALNPEPATLSHDYSCARSWELTSGANSPRGSRLLQCTVSSISAEAWLQAKAEALGLRFH